MLFHTLTFAVFLVVVLALAGVTRNATARKAVLLIASYVFYGWSVPFYLVPLLITTAVDFFAALLLDREPREPRRRVILTVSIVANLALLAWFKYFGFFATGAAAALRTAGFDMTPPLLEILLPVGISFYTFHSMSYTIDVYRREIPACRSALDYGLFITFFPVLVAGPILRGRQFLPQLREPVRIAITTPALLLIVRGYAKKLLVADNLSPFADAVFGAPHRFPSVVIWTATIAFAIQIYCDFSGYSDVARGVAALFGFTIPRNFDRPYAATNPSDFWRRWHISLSTWLRDYLYIPLGGSRGPHWKVARNLMITMLLGGLWHGAGWNFVLWGAMHGALLVAHRFLRLPPLPVALRWLAFMAMLLATWIPFRVTGSSAMLITLRKFFLPDLPRSFFDLGLAQLSFVTTVAIIAAFAGVHAWSARHGDLDQRIAALPRPALLACCIAIGAAFFWFWPSAQRAFLYFQF
jgi:alginate O-acetyltransferase complex protein AlgI